MEEPDEFDGNFDFSLSFQEKQQLQASHPPPGNQIEELLRMMPSPCLLPSSSGDPNLQIVQEVAVTQIENTQFAEAVNTTIPPIISPWTSMQPLISEPLAETQLGNTQVAEAVNPTMQPLISPLSAEATQIGMQPLFSEQGMQGMIQSSYLPSSSRDPNLHIGQEFAKTQFENSQFAEAMNTTMQPSLFPLSSEATWAVTQYLLSEQFAGVLMTRMQPFILKMFEEAAKTTIQPFISELFAGVLMTRMQPFILKMFEEVAKTTIQPFISELAEERKKLAHSVRSSHCQAQPSAPRSLRLQFVGSLPDTVFTMTKIQLRVELCDSTGSKVEEGPESRAKVRLHVLDGDFAVDRTADWTKEEFDRHVAKPRKDKGPLLKGTSDFYLIKGVADITDIAITDNSKSMRNGTFRLGAELVDKAAREAVSEPFKVIERRLRTTNLLSLEDKPCHLKHIGDTYTQKLATANIHSVKDFLQLYHTDPKALLKILRLTENKLSETVKIAEKSCPTTEYFYEYKNETEGVHLVLDCVFNIKGVTFNGQTRQAYESLNDSQKFRVNKLRVHAYETRDQLVQRSGTQAFASAKRAVTCGTDHEPGTKWYKSKWISIRAIVHFRIAAKDSVAQGRAAKRTRHV